MGADGVDQARQACPAANAWTSLVMSSCFTVQKILKHLLCFTYNVLAIAGQSHRIWSVLFTLIHGHKEYGARSRQLSPAAGAGSSGLCCNHLPRSFDYLDRKLRETIWHGQDKILAFDEVVDSQDESWTDHFACSTVQISHSALSFEPIVVQWPFADYMDCPGSRLGPDTLQTLDLRPRRPSLYWPVCSRLCYRPEQ